MRILFAKTVLSMKRACGFFCIRVMAQRQRKPVAVFVYFLVVQLLNYYPAVSEAFYSDVPLCGFILLIDHAL